MPTIQDLPFEIVAKILYNEYDNDKRLVEWGLITPSSANESVGATFGWIKGYKRSVLGHDIHRQGTVLHHCVPELRVNAVPGGNTSPVRMCMKISDMSDEMRLFAPTDMSVR